MSAAASTAPSEGRLAEVAQEFVRASAALDGALVDVAHDGHVNDLVYYRLRDVAIATLDLSRELLRAAQVETGEDHREVVAGMKRWLGEDREVLDAIETLAGLQNAHVLTFLGRPPTRPLHTGRAASLVIAAFVDTLFGDRYVPRGAP